MMARSRSLLAVLSALVVLTSTATAASATTDLTVRVSPGTALPFRTLVLGVPAGQSLTSANVRVFENGDPVAKPIVIPASMARSSQFGVVLVLDASNSMRGAPIASATEAARQFAHAVEGSSQLGIVTFNSTPATLLQLTSDQNAITTALAEPPALAKGTHIYDGLMAGVQMLSQAKINTGSIVLLSDGRDTGSAASEVQATAAARKAGIRIYSVGLRSGAFDASALEQIAKDGHGSFTEATSSAALAPIFSQLGQAVANQYIIRYRTSQPADTYVRVSVKAGDLGVATTSYHTLAGVPGDAFHRSAWTDFWKSLGGMIVIVLLSAALVGFGVALALRPGPNRLRARVGEFVTVSSGKNEAERSSTLLTTRLYAGAERSFGRMGVWARFKQDLALAEIDIRPAQIVLATSLGVLVTGWLIATVTGFPLLGLLGLTVIMIPRSIVNNRLRKRREAFAEQLPDNLQVMASAMRAGHSFIGALAVVVEDCPEPSRSEFSRVVADEQFGVPLEEAIGRAVERMDNRDLAQVGLVAAMQQETGGNTAEVLDRVVETIRERFELRRLVKTLTAQGRMSRWVVSLLPVGLLLIIGAINPAYMAPLFNQPVGRLLLVAATVLVVSGSLVIKRIVNIKV
jgi:tight adherence protein B